MIIWARVADVIPEESHNKVMIPAAIPFQDSTGWRDPLQLHVFWAGLRARSTNDETELPIAMARPTIDGLIVLYDYSSYREM